MYKFYIYAYDAIDVVSYIKARKENKYYNIVPYDKYFDSSYYDEEFMRDGLLDEDAMNEALTKELPSLRDIYLYIEPDENDENTIYLYRYVDGITLDVGELVHTK